MEPEGGTLQRGQNSVKSRVQVDNPLSVVPTILAWMFLWALEAVDRPLRPFRRDNESSRTLGLATEIGGPRVRRDVSAKDGSEPKGLVEEVELVTEKLPAQAACRTVALSSRNG